VFLFSSVDRHVEGDRAALDDPHDERFAAAPERPDVFPAGREDVDDVD
jgi:hypothetical protein